MPATKTLPEAVEETLQRSIQSAVDDDPVILWWDEGGFLESLISATCDQHGYRFQAAENSPLELRKDVPRETTVWYVPQGRRDDHDWFRDVEATGNIVEGHIGKLAAQCFEKDRLQAATIRTAFEGADDAEKVARTLYEELNGEGGLPSLQGLQTKIVLEGDDDAVEFVLEHGTDNLPDGEDLDKLRDLLVNQGVEAVEGETDPQAIVDKTRRWAVAEWLVDEGLDRARLPEGFRPDPSSGVSLARPELRSMLSKTEQADALARVYLDPDQPFWEEIVDEHEDPWELADCPVDASLEHRLWREWAQSFEEAEYDACIAHAEQRRERLETTFGHVPWTAVWTQAIDVAKLADELERWEEEGDTTDVVNLYGDVENGTWQIDHAVFNLIISGEPETQLPQAHPARDTLDDLRGSLLESRYLEYLSDLGDLVVDQIDAGAPFVDEKQAHQFFAEEQDHIQSGESAVLFIVDALRFDLAHELAETIRRELPHLEVEEEPWVGALPSDTEFGKAALTPGSKFSFNIALNEKDELVPQRNGQEITNHRRQQLLETDGWSYIMQDSEDPVGWSNNRVAYYWNDIDEAGEKELTNFEELFSDRIETLSQIICEKLSKGEWERAYILSDHGFVSLPSQVDIDDLHPPDDADVVTRRWVAGENLDEDAPGALLDEDTRLGYLDEDAKISILADPIQRFRNQGLPDARFYHGGILPQEFVLNFVTITQD